MSSYILITVGVIAILYLAVRVIKKATGVPVLKVKIGTEDGYSYSVEFEKLHPEMKEIEYVRLVLNYTGKILYVIEKKHDYVSDEILNFISEVSFTKMEPREIMENIPEQISIAERRATGKVIEGILYFKDIPTRNIVTKLPITWFKYQLAHSVFALIKVTVDKLDDDHREYLKDSLKYMSKSYYLRDIDPRQIKNSSLPNEAFMFRHMDIK